MSLKERLNISIHKFIQKKAVLKDDTIAKCLGVSSDVPTLKHRVEQQHLTQKQLFQLCQETSKQSFLGY